MNLTILDVSVMVWVITMNLTFASALIQVASSILATNTHMLLEDTMHQERMKYLPMNKGISHGKN